MSGYRGQCDQQKLLCLNEEGGTERSMLWRGGMGDRDSLRGGGTRDGVERWREGDGGDGGGGEGGGDEGRERNGK